MGTLLRLHHRKPPRPELLWREAVGDALRTERIERGQRLRDVADRAGLSVQYLSEIERGLKDPSSEMLHAIAGALDLAMPDLARRAASTMEQAVVPTRPTTRMAA